MDKPLLTFTSESVEETSSLAQRLAKELRGGEVITLSGDLGAGKTSFTQGLALGLGIKKHVNSPTFTLIKEYQGERLPLYHMDVYRVEDEFEELGFDDYFFGEGVSVIEWPQQIEGQLPKERLEIQIVKAGDHVRDIHFFPYGTHYEQLLDRLVKE